MDKENVIVLGNGFLGKCFARHGYDVWDRKKFSLFDKSSAVTGQYNVHKLNARLRLAKDKNEQLVVINTIGISDTRYCEDVDNWKNVMEVNAELPNILSDMCSYFGAKLVHISTGCLYDVHNIPQAEDDFISAHCNYVVSKWVGENNCDINKDLIIRPRLLFDSVTPPSGKRNNLICKLMDFDAYLSEFNTVTSNDTIVEAIEALLEADQVGVFNVGNTGNYTIYGMADALGLVGEDTEIINELDLHESQGLYLVNNIMDLSKLLEYYTPRDALVELKRCKEIMNESK